MGIYIIPIYYAFRMHIVVVFSWFQNNPMSIATRDKVTAVVIVLVVASLPTVRSRVIMVRSGLTLVLVLGLDRAGRRGAPDCHVYV